MALFKPLRGNRTTLDAQPLHDGYAYFCIDDGSFHIDYTDADGNLQRKQLNAKEAEKLLGYNIATMLNDSDIEIPTSGAVWKAMSQKSDVTNLENGEGIGSIQSSNLNDDDRPYTEDELPVASGHEAIAFGKKVKATGKRSVALGNGCEANGNTAISTGQLSINNANSSIVNGYKNTNTNNGNYSAIFGWSNTNDAANVLMAGYGNTNYAARGVVFGSNSTNNVNGSDSLLLGNNLTNNRKFSVVFGENINNNGEYTLISGKDIINSGSYSFVSGINCENILTGGFLHGQNLTNKNASSYRVVLGQNNADKSNTIFEIGNGSGSNPDTWIRKNAFEVYYNGDAAIAGNLTVNGAQIATNLVNGEGTDSLVQTTHNDYGENGAPLENKVYVPDGATALGVGNTIGDSRALGGHSSLVSGQLNENQASAAFVTGYMNKNLMPVAGEVANSGIYSIVAGDRNENSGKSSLVIGSNNINFKANDNLIAGSDNKNLAGSHNAIFGRYNQIYTSDSAITTDTQNFISGRVNQIIDSVNSVAFGTSSQVRSASESYALGSAVIISGSYGFGSGRDVQVTGLASSAIGHTLRVTGDHSHVLGAGNTNNGNYNTIIGNWNTHSSGQDNVILGKSINSKGSLNFAFGNALVTNGNQVVLGDLNEASTSDMFIIGHGINGVRRNVFTISNDGHARAHLVPESDTDIVRLQDLKNLNKLIDGLTDAQISALNKFAKSLTVEE